MRRSLAYRTAIAVAVLLGLTAPGAAQPQDERQPSLVSCSAGTLPSFMCRSAAGPAEFQKAVDSMIGQDIALRSANFPDRFVRHRHSLGYIEPVGDELSKKDTTFKVVPGLAGRCVSLESNNYPGQFLRHQQFRLKLAPLEDSELYRGDATFCMVPGLSIRTGFFTGPQRFSLESANNPGSYIRHRNFELWLAAPDRSAQFREDASFYVDQR